MYDSIQETLEQMSLKVRSYEEKIAVLEGSQADDGRDRHSRKSNIYIEEAPSSSSDRDVMPTTKEELSRIIEESRRGNSRLEEELMIVRSEL